MQISEALTKKIMETSYLTAINADRYRVILRYFYEEYEKIHYWLNKEDVFDMMLKTGLFPDYTLNQCQLDLQALQYDILYGKQYVYGGENPFEATKMQLGIYPATLERLESIGNGSYYVYGTNFTAASRLEINKELQETQYISPTQLLVQNVELADGDQVSVATQSNSSTKKVLSRTDYLTYNEDNGELMSQENYQAKKSAKEMLERLKEQHAEQTEDDGQAAEETPTEETTPELSLTPAPASTPES